MIHKFALILVWGRPLFAYFGLLTFLLILSAATVGRLNFKGNSTIPFKWHPRLAITAIIIGSIHMFLALSVFFGY